MSDDERGSARTPPADADDIGQLLRLAGPRDAVPADRRLRVRAAVHAEWRQQTRARARRILMFRSLGALAAAALVLLGVRLAVRDDVVMPTPGRELASIEVLSGFVRPISASQSAARATALKIGDRIREGEGVDTSRDGQAALRLAGGASVRMDRGTRLTLVSDTEMVLDAGAIYVDSGEKPGSGALEIRTKLGVVRDIGTRFEVRLAEFGLRVRVRDGLVRLSRDRRSYDAQRGNELTLDMEGGILRRTVPVHGTQWAWAAGIAQPFELEGRSLRDFLDWIAGENGWSVRFADAVVEKKSQTTILHGSVQRLTPEEALSAVLPASGVSYRLEDGVLMVRLSGGGTKD